MATQYVGRNPQQQILKNKQDIEELQKKPIVGIEQITVNNKGTASVNVGDDGVLCFNMATEINDGDTSIENVTVRLPIRAKTGIVLDESENGLYAEIGIDQSTYYAYALPGLPTTVRGTLPTDIVSALSAAQTAVITFNKENYYKSDNQHTTGTLVFSHTGYESGLIRVKTITVTISTRSWILSTPVIPNAWLYCTINLLDQTYSVPPLPIARQQIGTMTKKDIIDAWDGYILTTAGIFSYGDAVYLVDHINFNITDENGTNGGTVYCYKLSDGAYTDFEFSNTQLSFDECYAVPITQI